MNLGDAAEGPALAPGYAPAPQAEINAAIAAEEAPTPQEKAVTNPVTNVISALLTGRRLQQQPGPQQPGPQQQQPAAGTCIAQCMHWPRYSSRFLAPTVASRTHNFSCDRHTIRGLTRAAILGAAW